MRSYKRYIKWGLMIIVAIVIMSALGVYIYLTKAVYWEIDRQGRERIISEIKSTPPLPDRFYYIYNQFNPKSLEKSQLYYLLEGEPLHTECPCRLASYDYTYLYNIHLVQFTFWVESKVTQKECLNYYTNNIKFSEDIKGINNFSVYYHDKSINELSDKEILELVMILRMSSYYDKKKHPERVEEAVKETMKKIRF